MRFGIVLLTGLAAASASFAADGLVAVMGNWEGSWSHGDAKGKLTAKLIAMGDDALEAVFQVDTGHEVKSYRFPASVKPDGDKWALKAELNLGPDHGGVVPLVASIHQGTFKGEFDRAGSPLQIEMKRVTLKPPTLGARPPKGAKVLFDGTHLNQWQMRDGSPAHWKIEDGAMVVGPVMRDGKMLRGDIVSKEPIDDAKIHIEFMTPFMPKARGQGRGNSGVYVQGRYEVQVLDSFGLPPRDNEAGGIYRMSTPMVNAALPPGEWQTYDIEFHKPRWDAEGKLSRPAMITVHYNGVLIHQGVRLTAPTPGGIDMDPKKPGGILLQDHGNPVRFRNIWVVPLAPGSSQAGPGL